MGLIKFLGKDIGAFGLVRKAGRPLVEESTGSACGAL